MASWRRVSILLKGVLRTPRAVKVSGVRRVVGPGVLGSLIGAGVVCYYRYHENSRISPCTVLADEQKSGQQLSARRHRFIQFASVVYQDEPYMTPRDFLYSVMLENVDRLISYTEYLFLLTIVTKPGTGFHIAFKMLDVDGNEQVDKKEFLKVAIIILFLTFDNRAFMEDLQAEVQEMEFLQFSKGMDTMRREDFAEWLLHYTNEEDNELYWQNMRKKIPAGQVIHFPFCNPRFCCFHENGHRDQFKRAVRIATGHALSDNVLDTVFKLFDVDGDNCLSHKEFIGVMTDRVMRGLKVRHQTGISGYWKCVKRETLKGAKEAFGDGRCPI
uniref:Mitochondrial calcium uptake 2 n=1 Tax=Neogobius melanostomus TaxID=47308 RepID=A0A8C6TDL4_9GOBI